MRERREVNTRLLQEALGSRIEGTSFDLQVQGLGKTIFSPLSQKNQNPNPTPKTHNDTCPPPSKEMPAVVRDPTASHHQIGPRLCEGEGGGMKG